MASHSTLKWFTMVSEIFYVEDRFDLDSGGPVDSDWDLRAASTVQVPPHRVRAIPQLSPRIPSLTADHFKGWSGNNTINLTELEQSLSCPLTPRLTSQS